MGNKEHEGVREVWEGDDWSDGYGKYGRETIGPMGMGNTGTEEVREV